LQGKPTPSSAVDIDGRIREIFPRFAPGRKRVVRLLNQVGLEGSFGLGEFAANLKSSPVKRGNDNVRTRIAADDLSVTRARGIFGGGRVRAEIIKTGIAAVPIRRIDHHHATASVTLRGLKVHGLEFFQH
jgi:hypothetical protein